MRLAIHRPFVTAALLFALAWAASQIGIIYGERFVSPGGGLEPARAVTSANLFRFDSLYYDSLARDGYSYDGDPMSSPNIVFAPLFPLLTRALMFVSGLDSVTAGFVVVKLCLYFALFFLVLFLREILRPGEAFLVLLAMVTTSGSYAFQAYYSESVMLFFLSLSLLAWQRGWWGVLAISSALLGASRLTAFPLALVFSLALVSQGVRKLPLALIAVAGGVAYLAYIAVSFGNPLTLFPEIQSSSWGLFHPPTSVVSLLTGEYLISYVRQAFSRDFDIKTLNLLWTTMAGIAAVFVTWRWRQALWSWIFLIYFLFIYATNSSSDYLISAHRFFALMLPIFMMFVCLHQWMVRRFGKIAAWTTSGILLTLNLLSGIVMTGHFNQGDWYYF